MGAVAVAADGKPLALELLMRSAWLNLTFLLAAACTSSSPSTSMCTDIDPQLADRVTGATRSPDGAGWCCPAGTPTCDCGYFGGFVADPCACGQLAGPAAGTCDLHPSDWIRQTDAHGCERYQAPPIGTQLHCCNCPRDGGADAAP